MYLFSEIRNNYNCLYCMYLTTTILCLTRIAIKRYIIIFAVVDNDFALAQELGKSEHEDQEQKQFEALQVCVISNCTICLC